MAVLVMLLSLFVIVFAYMTLWFEIALKSKRYDVVDSAWGLGFVVIAWAAIAVRGQVHLIGVLSALLVSLWGLRLCYHISRRNWHKSEDKRYTELRQKWGSKEHIKAFTNVFLLQGILLLLISSPVIAIASNVPSQATILTIVGFAVWLFGILFEAVADYQLGRFLKQRAAGSHALMQSGLWRFSRHPNYFGEITVWWGAALVAISFEQWWGIAGALLITILITKVSGIPPIEKHYAGNPEFETYKRRTSVLIPLPPRK